MGKLSISAAWDESKALLARDGRLLVTVALALVALPSAINGLLNPGGVNASAAPLWMDAVTLAVSLIALAGQLALIRLALGPSITVGGAIAHGFRRLPYYFVAVLMLVVAMFVVAIPLAIVLTAMGVRLDAKPLVVTPPLMIGSLLYFGLLLFVAVRLLLSSSVASAEEVGPVAILKRSWRMTAGYWWPLFGFLLIFLVAALIGVLAIGSAAGVIVGLTVGAIQPMSASALIVALVQSLVSAGISTLFAVMIARTYLQLAGRSEAQASVPNSGI
jgi:hypothetical protein